MNGKKYLADQFEAHQARLRSVAYRMLGSRSEAEDAVQEAWLRLNRSDESGIDNIGGWLTTVVARLCLDMLRTRKSRAEEPFDVLPAETAEQGETGNSPEDEIIMADSVGLAMLVVLEALAPAERVAFVLHDMFAVPFDDIAPIVDRTPDATRQLASRARRRVQGANAAPEADRSRRQQVVDAFLAAARGGDFGALLELLDPDVVFRADEAAARLGGTAEIRGAEAVAQAFNHRASAARSAFIDGATGFVVMFNGEMRIAVRVTVADGRISGIDAIADAAGLKALTLEMLES